MLIGVHIIVKGLVQGVGFRYFVYTKATKLNLNGYVQNLYTGDVELEAEGDKSLIEELIKELKAGPRFSQVKNVVIEWQQPKNMFTNFEIR